LKECRRLKELPEVEAATAADDQTLHGSESDSLRYPIPEGLLHCINELPADLKEVILLRYVRGYPLDRLAEILQTGEELLENRLFAAEEFLTVCLKKSQRQERQQSSPGEAASPHPEIRRNFSAYLDSTAAPDVKAGTRTHLMSCGSCREALAELEWLIQSLKEIPDTEPPPGLIAAIMAQSSAAPAVNPQPRAGSPLRLPAIVAAILLTVIGISSYVLLDREKSTPPPDRTAVATQPPGPVEKVKERIPALSGFLPGIFKEGARPAPRRESGAPAQPSPVPLPAALPGTTAAPPALPSAMPPATAPQATQPYRKEQEPLINSPPEWGDSPAARQPLKKAAEMPARPSETVVTLKVPDPVQAAAEIESAVSASGGKVTGRGHSNGNDILYTRIDVDRFIDLMTRLDKSGRIQELPQPPVGAEGPVELIIRWR
jgi:hypothetical protein